MRTNISCWKGLPGTKQAIVIVVVPGKLFQLYGTPLGLALAYLKTIG